MQVRNILQSKGNSVVTLPAAAPVADAVEALNTHRIGAVVVVDATGVVVGILSERDVVRHLGHDPQALLKRPISEAMTPKVVTCTLDTPIADLAEQMTRFRIRHIPVIEDGKLAGIVSIGDVVKRKIEETEQEASALRQYIAS